MQDQKYYQLLYNLVTGEWNMEMASMIITYREKLVDSRFLYSALLMLENQPTIREARYFTSSAQILTGVSDLMHYENDSKSGNPDAVVDWRKHRSMIKRKLRPIDISTIEHYSYTNIINDRTYDGVVLRGEAGYIDIRGDVGYILVECKCRILYITGRCVEIGNVEIDNLHVMCNIFTALTDINVRNSLDIKSQVCELPLGDCALSSLNIACPIILNCSQNQRYEIDQIVLSHCPGEAIQEICKHFSNIKKITLEYITGLIDLGDLEIEELYIENVDLISFAPLPDLKLLSFKVKSDEEGFQNLADAVSHIDVIMNVSEMPDLICAEMLKHAEPDSVYVPDAGPETLKIIQEMKLVPGWPNGAYGPYFQEPY